MTPPLSVSVGTYISKGHSDVDSNSGDLSEVVDPSVRLLGGRLPLVLQCDYWNAHAQLIEVSHVHLLPKGKVPNEERHWRGKRRPSPSQRMLLGRVGCKGEPYVDD